MSASAQLVLGGGEEPLRRVRPADDHYRTPPELADRMLARLCPDRVGSVLDAGAGGGVLAQAVVRRQVAAGGPHPVVTAIDIDAGRAASWPDDWGGVVGALLAWAPGCERLWDLVISNPPFAMEIDGTRRQNTWTDWALACLPLLAPGGALLLMGFANTLDGQDRVRRLLRPNPPSAVLHCGRWSFTGDGATDPRDVVWLRWDAAGPRDLVSSALGLGTRTGWL